MTTATVKERALMAGPVRFAGVRTIATPLQYITTGEEELELRTWSAFPVPTKFARVHGRWLAPSGHIQVFRRDFSLDGLRTVQRFRIDVGDGALLNVTVSMPLEAATLAYAWAQLVLVRGRGDAAEDVGVVLQGYLHPSKALSYPGSPLESPLEGRGFMRQLVFFALPGGANYNIVGETNTRWLLHAFNGLFTTAAVAGTRFPHLFLNGDGTQLAIAGPSNGQSPGVTLTVNFHHGSTYPPPAGFGTILGSLPTHLYLNPPASIVSAVANMAAADQWTFASLLLEEWILPVL